MFDKLLSFWKESDLLSVAFKEVDEMLRLSEEMFRYAIRVLMEHEPEKRDIYKDDQKLNQLQIDVRRKVLEHLTISPSQDILPSLILITVIVDIERIGDYSKNLLELAHKYPEELTGPYVDEIKEIRAGVEDMFRKTYRAFTGSDKELGKEVMERHVEIAGKCEGIVERLIDDPEIGARLGIIYALLARFLKRVSAHLKNVASSVVNPFHRLGYKPQE